ncbi:alkaline phosphatase [Elysia marginata]|uniref:Alkaline phosphatase n=1 Tax=Elysia marginata TaxID=1093978 RepID=A0AAV4I3X8_9GAST|nr:alkaline phosphatase [Elysia marginata]
MKPRRVQSCLMLVLALLGLTAFSSAADDTPYEEEEAYRDWFRRGSIELKRALHVTRNQNFGLARNIILFLGDGMGISTVTASSSSSNNSSSNSNSTSTTSSIIILVVVVVVVVVEVVVVVVVIVVA